MRAAAQQMQQLVDLEHLLSDSSCSLPLQQDLRVANHALANELVRIQTHGSKVSTGRYAAVESRAGKLSHPSFRSQAMS